MNIEIIKDCCGCRSCEQSCPTKCIEFIINSEGFIYPTVDKNKCINCSVCLKKCPIYNYKNNGYEPKVYAFKNRNDSLKYSASGGACDAVARKIISKGGVVYGVEYDDNFNAKFVRITSVRDLIKIQSSKYVFSDTNNVYSKVKEDLKNGTTVLFSGTSCQVDGLLCFLGEKYDNLFCISIICHGVPSGELFKKYIEYKEKKIGKKIIDYNFRYKGKNGWGCTEKISTISNDGKKQDYICDLIDTPYGFDFLNGFNYRENCYNCLYTNKNRVGDWSVGDFWGVQNHYNISFKEGVSVVCVMTEKGLKMINDLSSEAEIIESKYDIAAKYQDNLKHPTARKKIRDTYYNNFNDKNFFDKRKPNNSIKKIIKKLLKKIIPNKILKRIIKH